MIPSVLFIHKTKRIKASVMPSLHLACDELTAIIMMPKFHFHVVSVRRPYDIVRFLGVVGSL